MTTALKVSSVDGTIKGRLPHGWHMAANFDRNTGIIEIRSPDTDMVSIDIDTSKLDEYSPTHKPTAGVLESACLEAKYDNGIIRYDSADSPEFWIEVYVKEIMKSKKQKVEPTVPSWDKSTEPIMPWKNMQIDNAVLTLWPGTLVKESDLTGLMNFFKEVFDIEPVPVGCVETLPDIDEEGAEIEDTGGRCDFFFYVKEDDVPKFAIKRFRFGMRWWEDIYYNNGEDIYPIQFREVYPNPV